IDNHAATPTHNVQIEQLRINVSANGSGFLRIGNRSSAYSDPAFSTRGVFRHLEVYGLARPPVAGSVAFDLTQMAVMEMTNVLANNFDEGFRLTTVTDSSFRFLTAQSCSARGIHCINTQPGAIGGGMDGSLFVATI